MSFLLDSIIESGLSMESIAKLRIVYISNTPFYEPIHESIQTMFKNAGKRSESKTEFPMPHIIVWKNHPSLHKDEPAKYPIQKLNTNLLTDYADIQEFMIDIDESRKRIKLEEKYASSISNVKCILRDKFTLLKDHLSFVHSIPMLSLHNAYVVDKNKLKSNKTNTTNTTNTTTMYSTNIMMRILRQHKYQHLEHIANQHLDTFYSV